jgi:hypothetical protein
MALLRLDKDEQRGLDGSNRFASARVQRRLAAAFRLLHRAIVAAKMRRLRSELLLYEQTETSDLTNYPQRPLILGEEWDF